MKKSILGVIVGMLFLITGCTPAIRFQEVSPKLSSYNPRSVTILPFTNAMGNDQANDAANADLANTLKQKHLFDTVVDAGSVKTLMGSNGKLVSDITAYRTKWMATGISDAALAASICGAVGADSILFGEISEWNEEMREKDKYARAGVNLRWVDKSGEILFKASHGEEQKYATVMGGLLVFGDTSPKPAMELTLNRIMDNWPKK